MGMNGRLLLGLDPKTGRPHYYDGEGSLATIAPPGSGKTQCHVLPNLMAFQGPCLVLDTTGGLWATTSLQRRRYGPVYKLDLENVEDSDSYNPFVAIRRDVEHVWEDAQEFSDQLFVKQGKDDGAFFDGSGTELLGGIVSYVARYSPDETRNFETVAAIASGGEALKRFIRDAKTKAELPALQNVAITLESADERTRANVQYTAKVAVKAWQGFQIAKISRISDWHPADLRRQNGTLYIRASSQKLETNAGFIRLVVGQHIAALLAEEFRSTTLPWFQLFLDEMPKLQRMSALLRCIDEGRNYRVRTWNFMQYQSQLEATYGEGLARGMIGACGVQAYMNPSFADGTAELISKRLGVVDHLLDGTRKPRVEPDVLAGPRYRDDVIVFESGKNPVRLRKFYYHAIPGLTALAGKSA